MQTEGKHSTMRDRRRRKVSVSVSVGVWVSVSVGEGKSSPVTNDIELFIGEALEKSCCGEVGLHGSHRHEVLRVLECMVTVYSDGL